MIQSFYLLYSQVSKQDDSKTPLSHIYKIIGLYQALKSPDKHTDNNLQQGNHVFQADD